eukprot:COSAG01_NODE_18787_length_1053_cov_1.389937_1_plen_169_part_10
MACSPPKSLSHGNVSNGGGSYPGKAVTYACDPGYNLTGSSTAQCDTKGSYRKPTCNDCARHGCDLQCCRSQGGECCQPLNQSEATPNSTKCTNHPWNEPKCTGPMNSSRSELYVSNVSQAGSGEVHTPPVKSSKAGEALRLVLKPIDRHGRVTAENGITSATQISISCC